jgi:hypothetical protein
MKKSFNNKKLLFSSLILVLFFLVTACFNQQAQYSTEYYDEEEDIIIVPVDSLKIPDTITKNIIFEIDHKSDQEAKIDSIKKAKQKEKK